MTPGVTRAALARIARLAEAHPEREVCGLVVRRGGALEVVELENAAPAGRARAAFVLAPAALLRALRGLDAEGGAVVALFHSHLDAPPEPSADDQAAAFCGGEPLWPGVEHVIAAVRPGRATEVRRYRAEGGALRPVPAGRSD